MKKEAAKFIADKYGISSKPQIVHIGTDLLAEIAAGFAETLQLRQNMPFSDAVRYLINKTKPHSAPMHKGSLYQRFNRLLYVLRTPKAVRQQLAQLADYRQSFNKPVSVLSFGQAKLTDPTETVLQVIDTEQQAHYTALLASELLQKISEGANLADITDELQLIIANEKTNN